MNGTPPSQIQIIAPFTAALDWMKMMLFKPFDFVKWLTIALTAFLGGHWGSSFRFRGGSWFPSDWNWKYRRTDTGDLTANWEFAPWLIALIAVIVLFAMVLAVVWMWVSARGRFMFTDCVVKNRGAIAEPWREFRREGNSYFLFSLVIAFGALILFAIVALVMWVPLQIVLGNRDSGGGVVVFIVLLLGVGLIWLVLSLFFALISSFMVPVMYRRRCTAKEAFFDVAKLIFANPGPFLLFVLFGIALLIGVAVIGTIVSCLTCCIGGLPYISTVILLPAIVWLTAYKLLFLRQFGDAYDVWAGVVPVAQITEPPPPPPPVSGA